MCTFKFHCNVCNVCLWLMFVVFKKVLIYKKLIIPIVCVPPTSTFLPSFICRCAVVSEIREFNRKKKKMMMMNSKIGHYL